MQSAISASAWFEGKEQIWQIPASLGVWLSGAVVAAAAVASWLWFATGTAAGTVAAGVTSAGWAGCGAGRANWLWAWLPAGLWTYVS